MRTSFIEIRTISPVESGRRALPGIWEEAIKATNRASASLTCKGNDPSREDRYGNEERSRTLKREHHEKKIVEDQIHGAISASFCMKITPNSIRLRMIQLAAIIIISRLLPAWERRSASDPVCS